MFKINGLLVAATAAAMLTTTTAAVAAPANPAASLSIAAPVRAGTTAAHGNKLGADVPTTTLISIGVLAALVVIVLLVVDSNGSAPKSP